MRTRKQAICLLYAIREEMPAWTSSLRHQQGSRFLENPTSRQIRLTCIRRGSAGFWSCKTSPGNRVALPIPSLLFELGLKMEFSCRTCRAHSCYFSVATLRPPPKLHGSLPRPFIVSRTSSLRGLVCLHAVVSSMELVLGLEQCVP